jgi:protein phosphatase
MKAKQLIVDAAGKTDRGRRRDTNQDHFLIASLAKVMHVQTTSLDVEDQTNLFSSRTGDLMVVADGMGGRAHGDVASSIAVRTITRFTLNTLPWCFSLDPGDDDDLTDALGRALERSRNALEAEVRERPEEAGMGTTVTLAYVLWPRAYVVHAGDSRCYLHRQRELRQLTTDHTYAQQMVEAGALEPEEAQESRLAHVLWNAVVASEQSELDPEVRRLTLEREDTLLLCSDGLTKHVDDQQIATVLDASVSSEESVDQLIAMANESGGSDNITVIVARYC